MAIKILKFRAYQDNDMIYQEQLGNYALAGFFASLYEDAIVMQFLGFYDNLGNEVYIGDVVNLKSPVRNKDVRLAEICLDDSNRVFLKAFDNGAEYGTHYIENVIGNVYEHRYK